MLNHQGLADQGWQQLVTLPTCYIKIHLLLSLFPSADENIAKCILVE